MTDALAEAVTARGCQEQQAAGVHLNEAVAGLRTAVYTYTTPRPRWLGLPGHSQNRAITAVGGRALRRLKLQRAAGRHRR